jgi:hypothetical protein
MADSQLKDGIWNTDNASPEDVLRMVRFCAASWQPGARLLGNVRACDIVRACDAAIPKLVDEQGASNDERNP